jgi:hypothetical protein
LFHQIDRDRVEALNEATPGSGKTVIKDWAHRMDEAAFLESDADEQLVLRGGLPSLLCRWEARRTTVPFTASIKLRTIVIRAEGGGQCPDQVKVFANADALDFADLEDRPPTQTLEMAQAREPVEYTVRAAKFPVRGGVGLEPADGLGRAYRASRCSGLRTMARQPQRSFTSASRANTRRYVIPI